MLQSFHPVLAEWFTASFGDPTDVQTRAWPLIAAGRHTLIAAPTGSGKTLAALLPCLNRIASEPTAAAGVRVLYVTPLKALNNDIHHHVLGFVEELHALAAAGGRNWPGIRCAVRTGDTTSSQRSAMLKRPPDVLVTTPESLFLLLGSEKGRAMLATVRQTVVDEIHDLAGGKRGAHLALSLERLDELCGTPVQRIGVSATQKPLERVARFLGGWEEPEAGSAAAKPDDEKAEGAGGADSAKSDGASRILTEEADGTGSGEESRSAAEAAEAEEEAGRHAGKPHPLGYRPRPVAIVESRMSKRLDVTVTMPDQSRPAHTREAVWQPLLDRIVQLLDGTRSAIVFVNSRRLCERLCLRLNDHVGYELARPHHGSVSRERRLEVERMLKAGELRCIVATSSLELGIDVGHVDLVIQIDSPTGAASGIQRFGRAGHAVGEASRGVILARTRGPLPEIAVLSRQIAARDIEEIRVPRSPLDVLAQQIVGMVAADDWPVERLYRLTARCDSYAFFSRARLDELLDVLSGLYPFAKPLLEWNREDGMLRSRSNSAMAAVTGAGTIPQSGNYPVHHIDSRVHLGELDEEFIQESRVGDVFQLGSGSWMIREIRQDRVYVAEAANRFSEVPFWRNEAGGRSYGLGEKVGAFVRELGERLGLSETEEGDEASLQAREETIAWLGDACGMERQAGGQLVDWISSQQRFCGLPTDRRMLVETYKDVMNQTHVILHNYCGRRVNRAWLLAIERQFETRLPYRLYGNAKDNGIELVLPEWDESWLEAIRQVTPSNLESLLTEAISGSPLLALAFRRIAETSLLLSRSFRRTPLWQKRLRGEELLRGAMPYAERFPLLREAMKECLYDYLDYEGLKKTLERIQGGEIALDIRETPHPSPFAAQFLADYVNMRVYEGDGVDESVRLRLLNVSKELAVQVFGPDGVPGVRPEAVEEQRRMLDEPERLPENAEGLYRLLKTRGDMTADELARLAGAPALAWLEELREKGRAVPADLTEDGEYRWICADERSIYARFPDDAESVLFVVGRYAGRVLSFTEPELCERYPALTLPQAREAAERLLAAGRIVRAPFAADEEERIWTDASIASRVVRLSISQARGAAEASEPTRWCGQIAKLQSALQGTQQPQGPEGLRAAMERLQGLYFPLSHWETILLPSRMTRYRKEDLDELCASGEVVWLGKKEEGDKEGKVAFFLAESRELIRPCIAAAAAEGKSSKHPKLLERLRSGGASFLTALAREEGKTPSELLPQLLDLVWEGAVSNDLFAPLRLSQAPKPRKGPDRTGSGFGRWYWTGSLAGGTTAVTESEPGDVLPDTGLESSAVRWARHLLDSFGLVNKELVAKAAPFGWDAFYPVLKQLEEWGTVSRGIYVAGDPSLQFTTREMAEAVAGSPAGARSEAATVLSAADPANPFGWIADWPSSAQGASFARKPGNYLVLQGDRCVYWIENNGHRIYGLDGSDAPKSSPGEQAAMLRSVLVSVMKRQGLVKVVIDRIEGTPVLETEVGRELRGLGAETDRQSLVLWAN
nr:DEAD/DEAH box helicase [Cohnella zeiphila]